MSSNVERGTFLRPMRASIRKEGQASDFPDIAYIEVELTASLFESLCRAGFAISEIDYATEFALDLGHHDFRALNSDGDVIDIYVMPCRLLFSMRHLIVQGSVLAAGDREWPFVTETFEIMCAVFTAMAKAHRGLSTAAMSDTTQAGETDDA